MAEASSRIPKIPLRPGMKRPQENTVNAADKRPRLIPSKALPKSTSTTNLNKVVGKFSESSKNRALMVPPKHLTNITNMRESMPVTGVSAFPITASGVKKTKRPAWDLKGRMLDMEGVNMNLRQEILSFSQRLASLEQEKNKLHEDVEVKSALTEEAAVKIEALEEKIRKYENENKLRKDKEIALNMELDRYRVELDTCKRELESKNNLVCNLTDANRSLQSQFDATKALLSNAENKIQSYEEENKKYKELIQNHEEKIEFLEQKTRQEESERRRLHNTIQELKGNIRVFCRVRPPLPDEIKQGWQLANIVQKDTKSLELFRVNDNTSADISMKTRATYEFNFDHVFCPSSSQQDVFHEISQLIQSALDGYNVCIFAYGQTGSGKTYTMEGPEDIDDFILSSQDERLGMIPRSVQQIFQSTSDLEQKGWKYTVGTSFLEIYNENIRDLLSDGCKASAVKCEIKKTAYKGNECFVSNVKTVEVTSASQVYCLLRKARRNRAVAATNNNEHSSRSHYLFQMKIVGENNVTGEKCDGILNLVDLAGSERVKESRSEGDRLTEAKNINKSLSNLGNVIMALCQRAEHIPYRNSKLTHLLMNSLGGSSKTLMFVNVSPWEDSFNETVNSLRFASKVNQCHIGTASQKKILR